MKLTSSTVGSNLFFCPTNLSNDDMHPTAAGKLTIHLTLTTVLEDSAAHAVLTQRTTSRRLRRCPYPADINMQFLSGSRCAVFTCRLSHVILQERTLILLHCPSTVNSCTRSTSFHSILTAFQRDSRLLWFQIEKCCQRLEREELGGGGNQSDPYHNFPSHPPSDVL